MKAIPSMIASGDTAAPAVREMSRAEVVPTQSLRCALDLSAWLDCRRAAEIALGIARALDDAHRCGVTSPDLRPENIFISHESRVSINASAPPGVIAPRLAAQYLSPEEARGEAGDVRSDLYAFGIVLYEMLTDRVPFDGKSAETIRQKHLHRMPEPPQVFRSDVPDALSDLVMRLLEKDPGKRPQRAADLFGPLQEVIEASAPAESNQSFADTANADIFTLDDFGQADYRSDCVIAADDSIFDIEFDEMPDDAMPTPRGTSLADPLHEPVEAVTQGSAHALSGAETGMLPPGVLNAPTARHLGRMPVADNLDSAQSDGEPSANQPILRSTPALTRAARDPFDPPAAIALERRAAITATASSPLGLAMKTAKDNSPTAEPGEAPLRWLALLLIGLIVAAAFVLYEIRKRAITSEDAPSVKVLPERRAAPAEARAPGVEADITAPSRPGAAQPRLVPPAEARAPHKTSSQRTHATSGSSQARPKRSITTARRRVIHSRPSPPVRRAKRR